MELERRAVELDPNLAEAWNYLGNTYLAKGLPDQATDCYRQAVKLDPVFIYYSIALATLLNQSGGFAEEIAVYQASIKHTPNSSLICNNLAWLLATCPDAKLRDGPQAVSLSEHACAMSENKDPVFIGTQAAANAEAGRFFSAIYLAKMAMQVANEQGQTNIAKWNQELLEQYYEPGKAYHERAPSEKPLKP
jgi:tetratricopeptide (TPR) repeat protein